MDNYLSIKGQSEGLYKEKGSKFLAYAFPVSSDIEVKEKLDAIKRKHYNARHHCFAYVIGMSEELLRAYDDGEPRHTAGDPILNQIRSAQLKDILVIVVRYFGGTKLGKSGLINAYKSAAKDALSNAVVIEKIRRKQLSIDFKYEGMNDIMHTLQQHNFEIVNQFYDSDCSITCLIPESEIFQIIKKLEGFKEVKSIKELPG